IGTPTKGGVISLSNTSNHKLWIRAGRRQTKATPATSKARTAARAALLRPACRSGSIGASPSTVFALPLGLLAQLLDQRPQLLVSPRPRRLSRNRVQHRRRQAPAAQLVGHVQ